MNANPSYADSLSVSYTLFRDVHASSKQERTEAVWGELVQRIRDATVYKQKAACPLISLATYGDQRTKKGSLRHAGNVLSVLGVEADYDGECVAPEEAQQLLQAARIEAVIYTSPSHRPEAPRWRVLAPFVGAHAPAERSQYVARLNRVLGGILANESFTLSQSYYVGRVEGAPEYKVLTTSGRPLDLADDVEPLYPSGARADSGAVPRDDTTDAELRAAFPRGEGRYQAMLKLSMRWAMRGLAEDDIAAALHALLDLCPNGTRNANGDLRTFVQPLAASAVLKAGETRRQQQTGNDDPPLTIQVFNAERAPVGLAPLQTEQPLLPFVIEGILPTDVGAMIAPGGTGKSTYTLLEAIHIILGKPFLEREIVRSGPVLFLTGEDSRRRIEYRLYHLCNALGLNEAERRTVAAGLWVEDLTGAGVRFVEADRGGNLNQTAHIDNLIEQYAARGVVLMNVDPHNYFGPGERYVNDGEAQLMQVGMRIVRATGAAVRYVHHTGKVNAREKATDQYAGRGGSAGADNARFIQVLQRWEQRVDGMDMPGALTEEDFQLGRVLSFNVPKISDAEPIIGLMWLRRRGWEFEVVPVESDSQAQVDQRDLSKLLAFLREQLASGIKHTPNSLDEHAEPLGFKRNRLRALVHLGREHKHILEAELPKDEQRGQRKMYLKPTEHAVVAVPETASSARAAPPPTTEDWRIATAVALRASEKVKGPYPAGVFADVAADAGVALPAGTNPAYTMGGILYRVCGAAGQARVHCPVPDHVPVEVKIRRSGQKGAFQYQFYIGDEPPGEDGDGL